MHNVYKNEMKQAGVAQFCFRTVLHDSNLRVASDRRDLV